jgi:hypothetical protein
MAHQTLLRPTDPVHEGGVRRSRRANPRFLVALVAALLVAVVGAGELAAMLRARSAPIDTNTATLGGLTLHLNKVEWVSFESDDPTLMDPSAAGGYQMPAQMMPDMPAEGDARLNLEVTLEDRTGQARALDVSKEFSLGGGKGDQQWKLQGDTFGELGRLNPGTAADGKLFFDLKAPAKGDPPLYLTWRRGGDTLRILLTPGGTPSEHHH